MNPDGSISKSYEQDYGYDDAGYSKSVDREWKDASGNTTYYEEFDYKRDANHNIINQVILYKDALGNTTSSVNQDFYYVGSAQLTKEYTYNYLNSDGSVSRSYSQTYQYDENNRNTILNRVSKDSTGKVTGKELYNYFYNENGAQITNTYSYIYVDASGNTTQSYTNSYSYDSSGSVSSVSRDWFDASGNKKSKDEITYVRDASGAETSATVVSKNLSGNVTGTTVQDSYVRDSFGRLISYEYKTYNASGALNYRYVYFNRKYSGSTSNLISYDYEYYNSSGTMYSSGTYVY